MQTMVFDLITASFAVIAMTGFVRETRQHDKIQTCVEQYITDKNYYNDATFVKCMQYQFPENFASAYKRMLESKSKLPEMD